MGAADIGQLGHMHRFCTKEGHKNLAFQTKWLVARYSQPLIRVRLPETICLRGSVPIKCAM